MSDDRCHQELCPHRERVGLLPDGSDSLRAATSLHRSQRWHLGLLCFHHFPLWLDRRYKFHRRVSSSSYDYIRKKTGFYRPPSGVHHSGSNPLRQPRSSIFEILLRASGAGLPQSRSSSHRWHGITYSRRRRCVILIIFKKSNFYEIMTELWRIVGRLKSFNVCAMPKQKKSA